MEQPEDWFKQIKAAYPKRAKGKAYEWPKAFQQLQLRFKEGHSFEDILQGTKDYCAASKLSGDYGGEYIKMASTFFGPGLHFLDEYELEEAVVERTYRKQEEISPEQRSADILAFERDMEKYKA